MTLFRRRASARGRLFSAKRETTLDHVRKLTRHYGRRDLSLAEELCDRHPQDKIGYRIVARDLSVEDLTYADLRSDSERFAGVLHGLGVKPGDRVATLMGKSREYLAALLGIWRLGAVHVPLVTAFATSAIEIRIKASGAKVVVCDPDQCPKLHRNGLIKVCTGDAPSGTLSLTTLMQTAEAYTKRAALGGDAPMIEIYTSGTTGAPKAVVVPSKALASFIAYGEFALALEPESIFWCAADPGWAYGLYFGILVSLGMGVQSVLLSGGFDAGLTLSVLEKLAVTDFAAAPTVYRSIRASGVDIPQFPLLKRLSSAGEPLTPEIIEWSQTSLGATVHDHYGQTEAGMLINNHHLASLKTPVRRGSMGRAMPGWRAAILNMETDAHAPNGEVGRLAMDMRASPLAWFAGYKNDPQKTMERFSADGRWYYTGDNARMDDDGLFHFSARDDDVIIMAGYRIGPFEVESVMALHPAVAESAVVAVPDEVRGEVIQAFVVLRNGFAPSAALEDELKSWVKENYAAHAFPRKIHFVTELPKTPSGKVQRFVLRKRLAAEANGGV